MDRFVAFALAMTAASDTTPRSRGAMRPRFVKIVRPRVKRAQGMPGARCTRGLVCNVCEETHTSIQVQRRHSGIPCAMALRLMPRSPRRRIRLVTVADGLNGLSKPGWVDDTSANLTPATGARTTRFCRTHQRRSSCAPLIAHGQSPPCDHTCAPNAAASTATRPNVRDDGQRPSWRDGMAIDVK